MKEEEIVVAHPSYYNKGKIEVCDFIASVDLDFFTGNAVKYLSRAGMKPGVPASKDLEKAIFYLELAKKWYAGRNEELSVEYLKGAMESTGDFCKDQDFEINRDSATRNIVRANYEKAITDITLLLTGIKEGWAVIEENGTVVFSGKK